MSRATRFAVPLVAVVVFLPLAFISKAETGDAIHAAHYLKLARDDGYADFLKAESDPAFVKVIKDPAVQEVLVVPPSYTTTASKQFHN